MGIGFRVSVVGKRALRWCHPGVGRDPQPRSSWQEIPAFAGMTVLGTSDT